MKITSLIRILTILIFFISCSDDCEKKNPTLILSNNGTGKADIQIKTSGGNTENINNILIGQTSEKRSFAPGNIEFTIAIQGVQETLVYNLLVEYCTEYFVEIDENNQVIGSGRKLEKYSPF